MKRFLRSLQGIKKLSLRYIKAFFMGYSDNKIQSSISYPAPLCFDTAGSPEPSFENKPPVPSFEVLRKTPSIIATWVPGEHFYTVCFPTDYNGVKVPKNQ